MKVKPRGTAILCMGNFGKCYVTLNPNQIWDATEKKNEVSVSRQNVAMVIPYTAYKKYFKEITNRKAIEKEKDHDVV